MRNFLLLCVHYIPLSKLFNTVIKEKKYFQRGGGEKLVFGGRGDKLVFEIREMLGRHTQNEALGCVWIPCCYCCFG